MQETKCWLAVDVGIIHLGLVLMSVTADWRVRRIEWHRLLDITKLRHDAVSWRDCQLGHTATITDRMAHVYQEYADVFERADHICIEQRPITGLQAVQESIYRQFRDRVELISPVKMHGYLGIRRLDYDERKEHTVALARLYFLSEADGGRALETADAELIRRFEAYRDKKDYTVERLHDVADAICIAVFALAPRCKQHDLEMKRRRAGAELADAAGRVNLECFRRATDVALEEKDTTLVTSHFWPTARVAATPPAAAQSESRLQRCVRVAAAMRDTDEFEVVTPAAEEIATSLARFRRS